MQLRSHFGSLEALKGRTIAMTWAYSPSYGKPLSVPQGIIGLMTRFGMNVRLAHPDGYDLLPDVCLTAARQAEESGGSFAIMDSMDEAFRNADVVYPKSWAPFAVMQSRTGLLREGDRQGLADLEKECLSNNALHCSWECDEKRMRITRNGKALYMHCLPADISGVSCKRGEVSADVFERVRLDTYRQAGFKPFVIAAIIFLSRMKDPVAVMENIIRRPSGF
jgi:knotted carbamoyltransferase YgeW